MFLSITDCSLCLQVTGTLLIYGLFMVEVCLSTAIAGLDEVVYYVNGVCRALEFLLAVCVVLYGAWECVFGEWSWLGASVLIVHSYCSVWLRARAGWSNFLLRREAARKISSLPRATPQQLKDHNDVCAICYQVGTHTLTHLIMSTIKLQQCCLFMYLSDHTQVQWCLCSVATSLLQSSFCH